MKIRTIVHNARERRQARLMAERLCRRSLLRLLVCASMLLSAFTRVIPQAGSASWWMLPLLLVPGALLHLLLCLVLRRSGTRSLPECATKLMGQIGGRILLDILALMTWVEAAASLTALVCFFTEGIDAEGTQITLAILTCAVLLWCLDQNGLPRGVRMLRYVLLGALAVVAVDLVSMAHIDGLYPVCGGGRPSLLMAAKGGASLSWPLVLLLCEPPVRENGTHALELPAPWVLVAALPVLFLLAVPHEVLATCATLAEALMIAVHFLHPAVKTLAQCLLMLGLFLLVACQLHTVSELSGVRGRVRRYLPHALLLLMLGTQCIPTARLWSFLNLLQRWMLLPASLLTLVLLLVGRGKSPCGSSRSCSR